MNLAIIISSLTGGGAERVAQIVGNHYVDKGSQVYYFILNKEIQPDYSVKGKIIYADIKELGGTNDVQRMSRLLISSQKIRHLKTMYKIDTAVSFMENANYLNILSKGKEKVITRVCNMLSVFEQIYPQNFYYKKNLISFFYKRSNKVIVVSNDGYNEMRYRYGVHPSHLIKIPNISDGLPPAAETKEWEYGEKVIVCAGRLHFQKQQERIIRAFSYAHQREPDSKLLILGKGPQLRYLKHICEKCHVQDCVVFVGFTDHPTYYYSHARAYVLASKVEGFSNATIEAMGCGTPTIVTDAPGACGEIVGKPKNINHADSMIFCRYGILTPNMPFEKLRQDSPLCEQEIILGDAMLQLLKDDALYEKYRNQALRRAKMFCKNKIIKKWERILEN